MQAGVQHSAEHAISRRCQAADAALHCSVACKQTSALQRQRQRRLRSTTGQARMPRCSTRLLRARRRGRCSRPSSLWSWRSCTRCCLGAVQLSVRCNVVRSKQWATEAASALCALYTLCSTKTNPLSELASRRYGWRPAPAWRTTSSRRSSRCPQTRSSSWLPSSSSSRSCTADLRQ